MDKPIMMNFYAYVRLISVIIWMPCIMCAEDLLSIEDINERLKEEKCLGYEMKVGRDIYTFKMKIKSCNVMKRYAKVQSKDFIYEAVFASDATYYNLNNSYYKVSSPDKPMSYDPSLEVSFDFLSDSEIKGYKQLDDNILYKVRANCTIADLESWLESVTDKTRTEKKILKHLIDKNYLKKYNGSSDDKLIPFLKKNNLTPLTVDLVYNRNKNYFESLTLTDNQSDLVGQLSMKYNNNCEGFDFYLNKELIPISKTDFKSLYKNAMKNRK